MKFGGGASDAQLTWLRQTLAAAAAAGQRVILCCHLALHPDTCPGACLLWNYEEVLEACWQAGNVVATFSGHAHKVLHQPAPANLPVSKAMCRFSPPGGLLCLKVQKITKLSRTPFTLFPWEMLSLTSCCTTKESG